ncbi:MAG TPA: tRNA uracil 4-sulfurtransferase ThiI [Anaerolineae bacterium]|nr:tRNA uracil 4-sulfurtransferase ThiI [Anaerolineae bacterium]
MVGSSTAPAGGPLPEVGAQGTLLVVRYGEIGLKGHNRRYFFAKLRRNVRRCLREEGIPGTVWQEGQRIFVETSWEEAALDALRRVFGVVSVSPVRRVPAALDDLEREAVSMARRAGLNAGSSFCVRARRGDKSFPLTSPEIGREVGAAVVDATGAQVRFDPTVDLEIAVEVRRDYALLSGQTLPGPGGMPVGSAGRVVALLSTGIDSPVAIWLMMKRGCSVIPVHFATGVAPAPQLGSLLAALQRYSHGWTLKPVILPHADLLGPVLPRLRELHAQRWTCLVCKRLMLLKAAEVAREAGASAIVTGDSLGQVASQTLASLEAVSAGIAKPILRPLIGYDKTEIMAMARRIGTYDFSVEEGLGCQFLPTNPVTQGKVSQLHELFDTLCPVAETPVGGGC